jgi:hypothetical protein
MSKPEMRYSVAIVDDTRLARVVCSFKELKKAMTVAERIASDRAPGTTVILTAPEEL